MKDSHSRKQLLSLLLGVLLVLIGVLVLLNAFFIWQVYFVSPQPEAKEALVDKTQTAAASNQAVIDTETPLPPTETQQPSATPLTPTITVDEAANGQETLLVVQSGDTVSNLATAYGVKIEDLRGRNQMLGDLLLEGQKIYLPAQGAVHDPVLRFSSLLPDETYQPIPQVGGNAATRFEIFMEEDRFAFQAREPLAREIKDAFFFVSEALADEAPALVTVYVAGGPFDSQPSMRADYLEDEKRLTLLHDGSGNLKDLQFHLTYGMALLWGEEVWGSSPDPVLREGMAYSLADQRNANSGNLRLCDVAYAYQQVEKLPDLTTANDWALDWAHNMVDLSTAGCYYQYLSTRYDAQTLQELYRSGDYSPLPTGDFTEQVAQFEAWLRTYSPSQEIDGIALVEQMDRLLMMNKRYFNDMTAWEKPIDIYYALDQARLALWSNDVRLAMVRLTTAGAMLEITTHLPPASPGVTETPQPNGQPQPTPTDEGGFLWTPFPTWTPKSN